MKINEMTPTKNLDFRQILNSNDSKLTTIKKSGKYRDPLSNIPTSAEK